MERLSHWIGGKLVPGESGRTGPVFNPATGDQTHEVDFASIDEVDQAVDTAREAFASWRRTSLSKRADLMFRIREAIHEHRADIARLITRAARQGALRRDGRGGPRTREHRVRHRCAAPAEGWVHRASLDRRRRVLDPPAAGRRRRHHAVQLPGDGAHVDVRERDRLREHVHPEAEREGPGRLALRGRAAEGSRPARRCLQRGAGRQGRRGPAPRAPRHRGGVVRRLDPDREVHLRDRHREREARAGARRREEPHGGAARCRYRHGGRCGGLRRLRVGR